MRIKDVITPAMCKSTQGGWIWYCDSCDTHGNADSSDEAKYMAEAHDRYHSYLSREYNEDEDVISYMDMDSKERDKKKYKWESAECLYATYFVNVNKNITYSIWDDLDDDTPNEPIDLEMAIELQKRLGLQ